MYLTEGAEAEAECYHGSRPSLGESMAAAVVVEHMAALQLHIYIHTYIRRDGERGRGRKK